MMPRMHMPLVLEEKGSRLQALQLNGSKVRLRWDEEDVRWQFATTPFYHIHNGITTVKHDRVTKLHGKWRYICCGKEHDAPLEEIAT